MKLQVVTTRWGETMWEVDDFDKGNSAIFDRVNCILNLFVQMSTSLKNGFFDLTNLKYTSQEKVHSLWSPP